MKSTMMKSNSQNSRSTRVEEGARLMRQCLFLLDELGRELMRENRAIQVNNLSLLQTSRILQAEIQKKIEEKLARLRTLQQTGAPGAGEQAGFHDNLKKKRAELQKLIQRNLQKAEHIHKRVAAEISDLNELSRNSGKKFPNFLQKSPPVMVDLRR